MSSWANFVCSQLIYLLIRGVGKGEVVGVGSLTAVPPAEACLFPSYSSANWTINDLICLLKFHSKGSACLRIISFGSN